MQEASHDQHKPTGSDPAPKLALQRQCACGQHTMDGDLCLACREVAVQRAAIITPPAGVLQRSPDAAAPTNRASRFGHDFSSVRMHAGLAPASDRASIPIQAKLAIGASNDPLEQEADRVADQVSTSSAYSAVNGAPPHIRPYAERANAQAASAPASVERALSSTGRPMDSALQQDMGQRFGHDFSHVRVHTGAVAEQSARDVHVNAYTVGQTIVFGAGQFAPETHAGRRLLAHELTHVVQQHAGRGAGLVMRDDPKRRPKTIDFDKEEEEEKKDAAKAAAGQPKGASAASSTADDGTLFFQNPKVAGDPTQPDRKRVFVEPTLTTVGSSVNIRFAYPASEISSGTPSKQVTNAKMQIGKLIAEVLADFGTYTAASVADERRIKQERARLGEAYQGLTASKPLNIFIATLPSASELTSDRYIPFTDRVYINANDVGDRGKLEAAIRLPLQNLVGGVSGRTGKDLPANSKAELKNTLLHEALHAMLITKGLGSDAQWEKLKASSKFKITGPANAQAKGEELIRKFLISQDEVFVYESVAMLYPPVAPVKADFDLFIKNAEQFLTKKGATISTAKYPISVSEKVEKKAVPWNISYRLPGSITLTAADIQVIDLLLSVYPNQF